MTEKLFQAEEIARVVLHLANEISEIIMDLSNRFGIRGGIAFVALFFCLLRLIQSLLQ